MKGWLSGLGAGLRVLLGVVLLQGVTGLLVYTALRTELAQTWPLFAALALAIGFFATLWFGAMVSAERGRTAVDLGERFSKERETIQKKAEELRVKAIREAERAAAKARGGGNAKLMLKTGVVLGGVVIGGGALMLTSFVTAGVLAVAGAGGGALGYWARMRQERLLAGRSEPAVTILEPDAKPARKRLGKSRAAAE